MLRHTTTFVLLTALVSVSPTVSGQAPRTRPAEPEPDQQVDPQMIELLESWSQNSKEIRKLKGEVVRRTYDTAFETERVGQGIFYYESPDKGRIDIAPAGISEQQLAARNKPDAKVPRNAKGQPYKLEADGNERWICDGQKLITIQDDEKTASLAELPESMQGTQIMNTPLPFLFGMPPDQALERFHLTLIDLNAEKGIAWIEALPKQRKDANNWAKAEIILDTRNWLPRSVKLTDPAGTKKTVYQFFEMKVNAFDPIWTHPFKVNLKGYKVEIIKPEGETEPAIPDLVGLPYPEAITRLEDMGIAPNNIRKIKGGLPNNAADTHRIKAQKPKAGTPLKDVQEVELSIWQRVAAQAAPNDR